MPVPEQLRLYGRTDLLVAVGHQQPPAAAPPWNAAARHRSVTRTITFHFTHGWIAGNWRASGGHWFGATFNLDLDGTLYQCEEMIVRTNHVGGAPDFTGAFSFVNHTSIGIEPARFGKPRDQGGGNYRIDPGAPPVNYNIPFQVVADPPADCDYSTHPGAGALAGTHRFSLKKMRGARTLQAVARPYYYLKVATFDDQRNDSRAAFPEDVLFTEEQYLTLVAWAKCMCEMHRIPKDFLRDPATGREHPWIDVLDLIQHGQPAAPVNENKERVKAFQGIIGHTNIQRDRLDPGPSIDYYRIKRGISDEWWYPVDLVDGERALDYLDAARVADYMLMTEHNDPDREADYFAAAEGEQGGYFPLGLNRLWHGGIHLPSGDAARPVYAMANGRIVAARITNGVVMTDWQCIELPFSRCFVLIRHQVHTRNNGDEVDYGNGSTDTVYSLYMHLDPVALTFDDEGNFLVDYDALPIWLNHYMIDHPNDQAPADGEVFFPDQPVTLSDRIGRTGQYIVGTEGEEARYGHVLHVEVFTHADVAQFAVSPWTDRVEDATEDIVCNLDTLNRWLQDRGEPGIDAIDIRAAVEHMRQVAVKHRSEWSLTSRDQLSHEIVTGQPMQRVDTADVVSERDWQEKIRPLCFQVEMAANPQAGAQVIGPFLNDPHVWFLHPLAFMAWMNRRVERHEVILRSQDKPQHPNTTNLIVQEGYVTGFVNPVPSAPPAGGYPEAAYSDNTYEITVNWLADQTALAAGPQATTRFHMRLLDAIDMLNDRPHGVTLVLGHSAAAASVHAGQHASGDAADVRPGSGVTVGDWFRFYVTAASVASYLDERDGDEALTLEMLQDPAAGRPQVEATDNSREWQRRLEAATAANDPVLTAASADHPNLLAELGQMRLHLHAR